MKNNLTAVLDFGSSKINVLVGKKSANNAFNIFASESLDYAGFMQGKFLLERTLKEEIELVINNAQSKLNDKIDRLFIGVPAEFCYNALEEVEVEFKIPTRLKQKQLDILINKVDGLEVQNKTLISKAPVEFTINHERKVVSPIGELITNLKCLVSEVFASDYFILLIEDILNELQVKEYQFISAEQVMGSCLLDLEDRELGAIIVDVGYISTSVSIAKGDGLTSLKSFSMGGGHITSDLAEVLNLQYDIAEELKRKLILTLRPNPIDTYDLVSSKEVSVSVQTANEIAFARIDLILENIEKCLKKLGETDSNKPIYLTGGGISYLKGIRYYSKNKLKRDIRLIAPAPLQLHKFELSSSVAVLNAACDFD